MAQVVVKRSVNVWDEPYELIVYQKSNSTWIAVGQYMGKRLQAEGATDDQAAIKWRHAAKYESNSFL